MRRIQTGFVAGALMFASASPLYAQNRHDDYYRGMNQHVRQGDYDRYNRDDERRHHHEHDRNRYRDDRGGVGPGKAALIGGAGGAILGAIFGGGLKGTIIGGAAGAGIGAIGGQLAQGDDHDRRR